MSYNRILLIGFRCTGKTTILSEISKMLKLDCFDTDELIEKEEKKNISKITNNGKDWNSFRFLETIKIAELLKRNNAVISVGGGLGVNDVPYSSSLTYGDIQKDIILNSRDTYKILLVANDDVIKRRIIDSKNSRPDLNKETNNNEEYAEENIRIMKNREKDYMIMADYVFDTSKGNANKNARKLLKIINKKIS